MRRFLVVTATAAAVRLGRPTAPRTFLRRQGQCTRRQKAALRELWPRYGVDVGWNQTIRPTDLFDSGPCVLDVNQNAVSTRVPYWLRIPAPNPVPALNPVVTNPASSSPSSITTASHKNPNTPPASTMRRAFSMTISAT